MIYSILSYGNPLLKKSTKDIDEKYYENYLLAKKHGVKFIAYRCEINNKEIKIEKKIKIIDE